MVGSGRHGVRGRMLRPHILNCRHEAERMNCNWLEDFKLSSPTLRNALPGTRPHLLKPPKELHQGGKVFKFPSLWGGGGGAHFSGKTSQMGFIGACLYRHVMYFDHIHPHTFSHFYRYFTSTLVSIFLSLSPCVCICEFNWDYLKEQGQCTRRNTPEKVSPSHTNHTSSGREGTL